MIFDSRQMIALREKYKNIPDYDAPLIILLDRQKRYYGEKSILEDLFGKVDANKQKDWFRRLLNEEPDQHIGAWFEIMLYGWLLERFTVDVEPEMFGNRPDFSIKIADQELAIEAKAFLISPEEREKNQKFSRIFSSLHLIKRPFLVNIKIKQLGEKVDTNDLLEKVANWLDTEADQNFVYQDEKGNALILSSTSMPSLKKVAATYSEGFWVNSDVLKSPLAKKAKQHSELRGASIPYIIAILLEPPTLSAEEVVEAWLGKQTVVYDLNTDQVTEEKIAKSGIHFFGKEIKHKSVTGTLVFRVGHDEMKKSRYLQCWYVQNPYANSPVNPDHFPAQARFVVMEQKGRNYKMGWMS